MQGQMLRVLVECMQLAEGGYRVFVVGVYPPEARIPESPAGVSRKIVNIVDGMEMRIPAFRIPGEPSLT